MPLFKFAKRLANWEKPLTVEELQKREFKAKDGGPDLRPSLQELPEDHATHVQAYAEHATRFEPPDRAGRLVTMDGTRHTPISTPGQSGFAFTRDHHREFVLKDVQELLELVAFVAADLAARRRDVPLEDVERYVEARLRAGDAEWVEHSKQPNVKKWVQAIANRAAKAGS